MEEPSEDDAVARILQVAVDKDAEMPLEIADEAVPEATTGRIRKELRFKDLDGEKQRSMEDAMIQQLDEHFTHEAVEGVPVGKSVAAERALSSRLLLTNKLELQGGWQAKARWIGGGHKDPDAGSIRTSSPTATFLGHQLILWMAAFCGWVLQTGDVSAAFLQGEELEREIYLRTPTWMRI